MASDKSWITLRNRRCSEFLNGLDSFMEIANNHVNNEGKAYCPCIRCANSKRLLQELPTIYAHIHDRGFLPSYTTWVHHGEEYANTSEIEALWESDMPVPTINNELFDVIADVIAAQNVNEENLEDGFNPFANQTYSMWPVVLTTYNTPPWLCMKESSFMLTLLIPGEKSPGKDIDVFLRPLVDELKMLWAEGVQTRDTLTNDVFRMHAALLWTINDYPARSILSGWSGQGYKACPTCNIDTPSCRVIGKTAYVGHRRFLPNKHKLRENLLFDGKKETRGHPRRLSNKKILEQLKSVSNRVPGKHPSNRCGKRKRDASERQRQRQTGPKRVSSSSWIIGPPLN
ncbi:putative Transposase-associated domain-containing protein [Helianthus debilis subsp. tardiflorus]